MIHPALPRGRELGLPVVSGILLTICFPPFHLLVPPFVALVPYLLFVGRSAPDRAGAVSVRRATFWMGVVYYGTLLYWLFTALAYYTWLALLGYLIAVIVLSTLLALAGWAVHGLRARHAVPFWLSLPVFWTAVEWVRGHMGDIAFPWLGLGHSLNGFPFLVGFADVSGVSGVTVWLTAANGALAEWVLRRPRTWPRWALALALWLAIPVGYSLVRWSTLETRPAARVMVIQPNIPEDLKLDWRAATDSSQAALDNLTRAELAGSPIVQLIVWPETALPTYREAAPEWTAWASELARSERLGLLYGAVDVERYPDGGYDYFNAAVFLDATGEAVGVYRKHYLVPTVERVPFIPVGWMRDLRRRAAGEHWRVPLVGDISAFLRWFGGFGRGSEEPVFRTNGAGFGVLICYESIFPGLSRTYRRGGADFLVNITNDAWFGRERPIWSRTSALYQHPAHLVMRAIENRMGVARAANTGISLFVDPRGRVGQATELFTPASRVATVETTDGPTLYTRLGDWPGGLSLLGSVILLTIAWRRRRRRPDAGPPVG